MSNLFRLLPSVDAMLNAIGAINCAHSIKYDAINSFLSEKRIAIRMAQVTEKDLEFPTLVVDLTRYIHTLIQPQLRKVINATGVVIHTNLGRSVLSEDAIKAVNIAASGYSNLEFDLSTGERGSRHSLVERDICTLTGAESALVVNNNAAAVLIMLNSLCENKEVIVSRGQLVEIGGSFRIPEVMKKSGAFLHEIGTTNRCHHEDYEKAINENTSAILRVHTSNYRIIGFHSEVATKELSQIAQKHNIPLLEDLGSGSLVDFTNFGLPYEPTVQEVIANGVDVVTFSGDKVLGGPQAGIIAGKKIYIDKIKKNQLLRALRCDKLTLSALEATLRAYHDTSIAMKTIPTLRAMVEDRTETKRKAQKLSRMLKKNFGDSINVSIQDGFSKVGGGSFPEHLIKSSLVCLDLSQTQYTVHDFRQVLLQTSPPIVGRIEHDNFVFDMRTLNEEDFIEIIQILKGIL